MLLSMPNIYWLTEKDSLWLFWSKLQSKEERLKNTFSEVGTVTDCSLKYTKEGVFRKFAFVGFATEEDAQKAVQRFHNSFIDTSRVQVLPLWGSQNILFI